MATDTVSITLAQSDLDYARGLVEQGLYTSIEAAIRGELSRVREMREEHDRLLTDEVLQRASLPKERWIWTDSETYFEDRFKKKHGLSGNDS